MPDVLLVEPRQPRRVGAFLRHRVPVVPVGHQLVAVGIGVDEEDDVVVQDPQGLLVVPAGHLVDHFAQLLGAEYFAGVQAPIDPHDGAALLGECPGIVVAQPLRQCQAFRDVTEMLEILEIRG